MKKVLYVIGAIALIYLACCLIGPSVIKVERSATINASADAIKSQIVDYNMWVKWSPWQEKDPNVKTTIEGEAGKAGHKYSWEGNKDIGKGTMELTSIGVDTIVEKLVFEGKGASDVSFIFKADGATTNVNWTINMPISFFGRGMMMFMKGKMDKMLGGDFEKGLEKLKTVVETKAATPKLYQGYEIKELAWDEKTFYGKKANVAIDKLGVFFAENFPKIGADFGKNKIAIVGGPSCLFFTYDEIGKKTQCAAVMGVANGTVLKGWEKFVIPASKVLQITYFGAFNEKMKAPHNGMDEYMKEKGLIQNLVLEEYVTDPMVEKDTAKWQTNIFYILK